MKKSALLLFIGLMLAIFPASGWSEAFYEGKTITFVVATKPGGGYDVCARLVAKYMQKYLPGSMIIVKNRPGAGHIIGCSEVYNAKPDGLTIGTFNRSLVLAQLAELQGINFDLTKMSWLGSATSELYCLVMVPQFKTLDDIQKAPVVKLSSAGLGSQSHVTAELFKAMFEFNNIKVAPGFGGGEAELGMMRGELDGQFGSFSSLLPFLEQKKGNVVLMIGKNRPKGFENAILLDEALKNEKYKPIMKLLNALNILARPFAGPPGIPADRLKILQEAFYKTCADPEFIAIAEKAELPVDLTRGDDALNLVKDMIRIEPQHIKLIKEAFGSGEGN